jgi:predicted lipoprotein with Yx(FWY)xxD motif
MNRLSAAALSAIAALATASAAIAATAHTSAASTVISTRHTSLGTILVNGAGMTVYLDAGDKPPKFACTGGCLGAWPPVKAVGKLTATGAAKGADLGSVKDGNYKIVTYNGHPLYTFSGDSKPGQVTGEGSNGFFVVTPSGVKKAANSTTTTTTTSTTSSGGGYW